MPRRVIQRSYPQPATRPGTLRAAEQRHPQVRLRVLRFGPDFLHEVTTEDPEVAVAAATGPGVAWIDVLGLHDLGILEHLAAHYGLHPLAMEDALNSGQRPKVVRFDASRFVVTRYVRETGGELTEEQVSLFGGEGTLLSLHNGEVDLFDAIRARCRAPTSRMRTGGVDYMTYALLDAMVDEFYPLLESIGERFEVLEAAILDTPKQALMGDIRAIKQDLLILRRAAWPVREVLSALERDESVPREVRPFYRDCYDHTVEILDMVETYREVAGGLAELYLSSTSYRANEIMRVLTVMASLFIPLTFVTSLYGMNFNPEVSPLNMPELNLPWGYPAAIVTMVLMAAGLVAFFRRREWL